MNPIYFTHGTLDDEKGVGITVACFHQNDDGEWIGVPRKPDDSVDLGYKPKEITREEFDLWRARIANPDMVEFFPGVFPGVGVVDKATFERLQAERQAKAKAHRKITSIQGLKALARKGHFRDGIYAAIDKKLGKEKAIDTRIDLDESVTWVRSSAFVANLSEALGLKPEQMDEVFETAASL